MTTLVMLTFLFLKTGEKFATQEVAGPTVAGFTSYVATQLGDVQFAPVVMNDPQKAAELVAVKKPAVGIVTPGFYFAHADALTPLLEVQRAGVPVEKYVVVARKGTDWKGKPVATSLAAESRYVQRVILRGESPLTPVADVETALFDLAAGKGAAAVLVEAEAWKLFAGDPELAGELVVVQESEALPGSLVVACAGWTGGDRLKQALKKMGETEEGKKVLASLRVAAFTEVDQDRLKQAEKRFHGR